MITAVSNTGITTLTNELRPHPMWPMRFLILFKEAFVEPHDPWSLITWSYSSVKVMASGFCHSDHKAVKQSYSWKLLTNEDRTRALFYANQTRIWRKTTYRTFVSSIEMFLQSLRGVGVWVCVGVGVWNGGGLWGGWQLLCSNGMMADFSHCGI